MLAAFLFWYAIVSISALILFVGILIHDRIKYGDWGMKDPDDLS